MRIVFALFLVLPLAGCLSLKEAAAKQEAAEAAADNATCTKYGFKKDTPEFANCLMALDQTRKGQDAASHQAASQAAVAQGAAMIQAGSPHPMVSCNPNGIGGVNCY